MGIQFLNQGVAPNCRGIEPGAARRLTEPVALLLTKSEAMAKQLQLWTDDPRMTTYDSLSVRRMLAVSLQAERTLTAELQAIYLDGLARTAQRIADSTDENALACKEEFSRSLNISVAIGKLHDHQRTMLRKIVDGEIRY